MWLPHYIKEVKLLRKYTYEEKAKITRKIKKRNTEGMRKIINPRIHLYTNAMLYFAIVIRSEPNLLFLKGKKVKVETLSITRIKMSLGLKQTNCQSIGSNTIIIIRQSHI